MSQPKIHVQIIDDLDGTVIDGECSTFYYKFGGEVCQLDLNAENATTFLKFLTAASPAYGTKKQLKKLLNSSMQASTVEDYRPNTA